MKTTKLNRRSVLASAVAASALAALPRAAMAKELLRMSTLGPGTTPNLVMTTFANIVNRELPDYEIQVNATGAATRHVLEVAQGKTAFCMSSPSVNALLANQKAMFSKMDEAPELAKKLRAVLNFPMGVYHIAVYEFVRHHVVERHRRQAGVPRASRRCGLHHDGTAVSGRDRP